MRTKEEILGDVEEVQSLDEMNKLGMEIQLDIRDILAQLNVTFSKMMVHTRKLAEVAARELGRQDANHMMRG